MPTTNPFFSNTTGYSAENQLIDDLVIEQIGMFGLDILYMPRRMMNLDKLLHESTKSAFEFAMSMPVYLKSFSGYQNGMELLSKFGVRSSDEITVVMSRSQWTTYYGPFVKSYYNSIAGRPTGSIPDHLEGETAQRPKEGDLIYFPFDDGIFEIKYVMFDQPFFQLGQGYVFEMQCEKFEYSGETFSTGVTDVDDSMVRPDYYRLELTMDEGDDTFKQYENVTIYNVGDPTSGFDESEFRLYKDAGFLHGVPSVTGKVRNWNFPNKKLTAGDLSDLDPSVLNKDTGIIELEKFDKVLVIGEESGAIWYSSTAGEEKTAFNDSITLQDEFNDIKIIDLGDENPFGFY